ncbi:hypothetical protein L1N85_04420 [Paenibacillus alkaliterrae]|uniref:hypothetical protein n=1 Tax=Paenibacillus alkaliterrae TaxID=320909 RepID=UPI001F27E15D|nr:hypothetical protein [Paenibacillus alkaliterrae]MCF2937679.1 hypothetical protein [Paenibacillus alkaliterrae]
MADLWNVSGPLIIATFTAIALGIVCLYVFSKIPDGSRKGMLRPLNIFVILVGFLVALFIAAGFWGYY